MKITDAFKGKIPIASRKNTYPVYYQGPNLSDGYSSSTFSNDLFAKKGFLVRLPNVIRIHIIGSSLPVDIDYYKGFGPYLAAKLSATKICVCYGTTNLFGGGSRYLALVTPGFDDSIPPAQLVAGRILNIIFHWPYQFTYGDGFPVFPSPTASDLWQFDYPAYIAAVSRCDKIRNIMITQLPASPPVPADNTGALLTQEQISGTGAFAPFSPSLANSGFSWSSHDLTFNHLPLAFFDAEIKQFFDLP